MKDNRTVKAGVKNEHLAADGNDEFREQILFGQ
jgi:hypothetical protein